ncbi:short-chain dehydrogenase/reductase [Reticulibacter mediterranei]|uniref:Short-chain dehydrogenase/reductase n=1 Tax=Reticulibacter mediterranei TaxID=2778369 RepID=A0A8J3IYZ9_9CHLR|nr:SDR family oxidoreductase [Reticulibacter mediterranei]GHO99375.1 short-chain dehydrogenase/reductase [Reticulibacter mediterranei]
MSSQQVVLVTGSSSGFGRRIVETLARQGHNVFASMREATGRNAAHAQALRELAQREQLALSVLDLDVTSDTSVDQAVQSVLEQAGRIDVLINNAGIVYTGVTEAYTLEQVQAHMEVNFFGQLRLDRAVLPAMHRQHSGLLIHMSSVSGGLLFPFVTLYSASKMALEAVAEGYHYELTALGIESIILEPGLFATGLLRGQQEPHDQERLIPYGELANIPAQILHNTEAANSGPEAQDPQLVANVVADLIAQPRGTRPLRTIIGTEPGLAPVNVAKAQAQQSVLDSWGLRQPLAFKIPDKETQER